MKSSHIFPPQQKSRHITIHCFLYHLKNNCTLITITLVYESNSIPKKHFIIHISVLMDYNPLAIISTDVLQC